MTLHVLCRACVSLLRAAWRSCCALDWTSVRRNWAACACQGCMELSRQLPCYADLSGAPAGLLGATPPWLADSVLAARVQFLLGMLTPCASQLPAVSPQHCL